MEELGIKKVILLPRNPAKKRRKQQIDVDNYTKHWYLERYITNHTEIIGITQGNAAYFTQLGYCDTATYATIRELKIIARCQKWAVSGIKYAGSRR